MSGPQPKPYGWQEQQDKGTPAYSRTDPGSLLPGPKIKGRTARDETLGVREERAEAVGRGAQAPVRKSAYSSFGGWEEPPIKDLQTHGWSYLKRIKDHPDVVLALNQRIDRTYAGGWSVAPPPNATRLEQKITQLTETMLQQMRGTMGRVLRSSGSKYLFGWSLMEKVWNRVSGGELNGLWAISALTMKSHEDYRFVTNEYGEVTEVKYVPYGSVAGKKTSFSPNKFLHTTTGWDNGAVYGQGAIDSVAWWVWLSGLGSKGLAIFSDKFALPHLKIMLDGTVSKEDRAALATFLDEFQQRSGVVLPKNVKAEFLQALYSGIDGLDLLQRLCSMMISKALKQPPLTSSEASKGTGSYALGAVHQDTAEITAAMDREEDEEAINEQVVEPFVRVNWGPDVRAPRFQLDGDWGQRVAILNTAVAMLMNLARSGVEVPVSYLMKIARIPVRRGGEPILTPSQIQQGMGVDNNLGLLQELHDGIERVIEGYKLGITNYEPNQLRITNYELQNKKTGTSTTDQTLFAGKQGHEYEELSSVEERWAEGRWGVQAVGDAAFSLTTLDGAADVFGRFTPMSRAEFDLLDAALQRQAFTAAGLAADDVTGVMRDLLSRALENGWSYEDFAGEVRARQVLYGYGRRAGQPIEAAHLETIFRSNVAKSYELSRLQMMSALGDDLWGGMRSAVADGRTRPDHLDQDGKVFAKDDEYWVGNTPPYLNGEFQHNCRCVWISIFTWDDRTKLTMAVANVADRLGDAGNDEVRPYRPIEARESLKTQMRYRYRIERLGMESGAGVFDIWFDKGLAAAAQILEAGGDPQMFTLGLTDADLGVMAGAVALTEARAALVSAGAMTIAWLKSKPRGN